MKTWNIGKMKSTLFILHFLPAVVLSQYSISQSGMIIGEDVTVTCTITGTAPSLIDWTVENGGTAVYTVSYPGCVSIGASPYTPSGCATSGSTHTANMIIASAGASEAGKQWKCGESGGSAVSSSITIVLGTGSCILGALAQSCVQDENKNPKSLRCLAKTKNVMEAINPPVPTAIMCKGEGKEAMLCCIGMLERCPELSEDGGSTMSIMPFNVAKAIMEMGGLDFYCNMMSGTEYRQVQSATALRKWA